MLQCRPPVGPWRVRSKRSRQADAEKIAGMGGRVRKEGAFAIGIAGSRRHPKVWKWHEAAVSRVRGLFRSRMKSGRAADITERPSLTHNRRPRTRLRQQREERRRTMFHSIAGGHRLAWSRAFASFRSARPNPSLHELKIGASTPSASSYRFCPYHNRARLVAERSSNSRAPCSRAKARAS